MSLSALDRRLVRLSAAIALGRWPELAALRRAAPAGEPDRSWREVVLQAHLFAGFPRVVEAASVLAEAGGLGALEPDEHAPERPDETAGRTLFEAIYADQAEGVRAGLERFHPLLARWIAEHAYARVLARPGLSAARRELCAVAALAVQGQERQLASHARGAVRLGASALGVREVVEELANWIEPAALERAREIVARFARHGNL